MPSSRGSSQPRDRIQVSNIAGRFFTIWATMEVHMNLCGILQETGWNCYTCLCNMQEYVLKISMLREPRVDLLKAHLEETSSPIRNIKYLCEQNNKKKLYQIT